MKSEIKKYSFPFYADPFPKNEQFIRVKDIQTIEEKNSENFLNWLSNSTLEVVNFWKKTGEGTDKVLNEWKKYNSPRRLQTKFYEM